MKQATNNKQSEEWLKVLGKGMVTLPKKWRVELGIENGDRVKAKKEGNKVIIEAAQPQNAPYRIYTKAEINEFIKEDTLPQALAQKVEKDLSNLSQS